MKQPLPLYWDEAGGRLLTEIQAFDREFLRYRWRPALDRNPVGLDRGQVGPTAIVRFERVGPKVLPIG